MKHKEKCPFSEVVRNKLGKQTAYVEVCWRTNLHMGEKSSQINKT